MNQNTPHCFLLDGKTILPINDKNQLVIPLKILNDNENKYSSCHQRKHRSQNYHCQYSIDKEVKATNNNRHCRVEEEKDVCLCSFQSTEDKHSNNKIASRKIVIAKRKYNRFNQQINDNKKNIETYLITRVLPSIDSISSKNNHNSPSTINIIIKPFISSKNHQEDIFLDEKLPMNKRKNSSSSLQTFNKRISTPLLNQTSQIQQRQLSTFKELARTISPSMVLHKKNSSNLLQSRTLLDIYLNKKQQS